MQKYVTNMQEHMTNTLKYITDMQKSITNMLKFIKKYVGVYVNHFEVYNKMKKQI